ncbi:MAG: hypothetical protein U0414_04010 [Polyangiaceae bacterium]
MGSEGLRSSTLACLLATACGAPAGHAEPREVARSSASLAANPDPGAAPSSVPAASATPVRRVLPPPPTGFGCPSTIELDPQFALLFPRCTVDTAIASLAGRCEAGHDCMRPCKRERHESPDGTSGVDRFEYDAGGRLVRVESEYPLGHVGPDDLRRYEYDGKGRLVAMSEGSVGRSELTYDAQGRLSRHDNATTGCAMHYEYDEAGRLARNWELCKGQRDVTWDWTYHYDASGRVDRDGTPDSEFVYVTHYDEHGLVVSVTRDFTDGRPRWSFEYTYGADGRLELERELHGAELYVSHAYVYDDAGRLLDRTDAQTGRGEVRSHYVYDCR